MTCVVMSVAATVGKAFNLDAQFQVRLRLHYFNKIRETRNKTTTRIRAYFCLRRHLINF